MTIPFRDATTLSLLYHLNSEPWSNREAYEDAGYAINYKKTPQTERAISLPTVSDSFLMQLLKRRSSCRGFKSQSMPLATVSTLLGGMYGIARLAELQNGVNALLRTTPSAGALFPLEIYTATIDIEGLPDGIHHYAVQAHSLEMMGTTRCLYEHPSFIPVEPFVRHANLIVLISAIFDRTQNKYGPRGYRYILLEAGHAAQNLCLLATEQGLGSLCIGGFFDGKLNRLLGFDGIQEAVVYAVAVGYPGQQDDRQVGVCYPSTPLTRILTAI